MKESQFWKWLDTNKPSWAAMERYEVMYPPGMSDVFVTNLETAISGWIELKQCTNLDDEFKAGRIPKLKPEQPMFLQRQAKKGIPAGILMRVNYSTYQEVYLWRAHSDPRWVDAIRTTGARTLVTTIWRKRFTAEDILNVFFNRIPQIIVPS